MRATIWARYGTVVCASLSISLSAAAQCVDRPLPTSGSTRGLAMGDANLASRDDDVIFYGPAQLAVARGTSVAGERYLENLSSGTIATTARVSAGGVGVGAQIVGGQDVGGCSPLAQLPNGSPAYQTVTRSLAVVGGALPFKRYRLGIAGKFAREQVDTARYGVVLADVGVSRDFTLGDFVPLTAAIVVQGIGPDPTRAMLLGVPRQASLGLSGGGPVGPLDLALAFQSGVEHTRSGASEIKNHPLVRGGVEIGYTWLDGYSFSVRAGERTASSYALNRHLTFGGGLVLDRVSIDYAVEDLAGARYAHRVGLRLR
jgi:hypothetical protein